VSNAYPDLTEDAKDAIITGGAWRFIRDAEIEDHTRGVVIGTLFGALRISTAKTQDPAVVEITVEIIQDPGEDADPLHFVQSPALVEVTRQRLPVGSALIVGNGGGPGPTGSGLEITIPVALDGGTGEARPSDLEGLDL
jgi:hypothetical protein